MEKIATIIKNFDLAISAVKKSDLQKLGKLEESIKISRNCLFQLRLELRKKDFISTRDEIFFFKHQKPYIRGKLNFYLELNNFLINYPISGIPKQRNYINEQLNNLEIEKSKVFDFAKYCKLKSTKSDYMYFLKANNQLDLFTNKNIDDPEFSTSHDYLASQIITHDLLMKFYVNELNLLKIKKVNVIIKEVKPTILNYLTWTGTNTELVELFYGLNAAGAINNGKAEMKKIAEICKVLFDIDLGNIYKTFDEIKTRKKDPTKFIDLMKTNLLKKLNSEK